MRAFWTLYELWKYNNITYSSFSSILSWKKQITTTKKHHKERFYITEFQNISRIVMQIVSTSASVFHSVPIDLE